MKKFIFIVITLAIIGSSLLYKNEIINFVITNFMEVDAKTTALVNNDYASRDNFSFVQITDNFEPKNRQDIINIYYTILNSGMKEFSFSCPTDYKNCLNDVDNISKDQNLLSNINNYVPIYNSFQNIETEFDTLGKINIMVTHNYANDQITEIENKANEILETTITSTMNNEEKIKAIHDYIINNTKYDKDRSDNKVNQYYSDTAYGALIENYAICGGYSDSMKLFLDKLGIVNYKISSENHIWNLVNLNGSWYHLDLTWDDPLTNTGEDVLEYDYFLISTEELQNLKTDQHFFDKTIYSEAV